MELYADYDYYISSWSGNEIPAQEEFLKYAPIAQRYINYITSNRINEITTAVKNALCHATEELYKAIKSTENIPSGIKSESNDSVSVTYSEMSMNEIVKQRKRCMYIAIEEELSGTGLLYKGNSYDY